MRPTGRIRYVNGSKQQEYAHEIVKPVPTAQYDINNPSTYTTVRHEDWFTCLEVNPLPRPPKYAGQDTALQGQPKKPAALRAEQKRLDQLQWLTGAWAYQEDDNSSEGDTLFRTTTAYALSVRRIGTIIGGSASHTYSHYNPRDMEHRKYCSQTWQIISIEAKDAHHAALGLAYTTNEGGECETHKPGEHEVREITRNDDDSIDITGFPRLHRMPSPYTNGR